MKDFGGGVWEAIKQVPEAALQVGGEAWDLLRQEPRLAAMPTELAAKLALKRINSLLKSLDSLLKNAGPLYKQMETLAKKAIQNPNSGEAKTLYSLYCNFLGQLTPDLLISLLTGGAASGKAAVTLSSIATKLSKVGKLTKVLNTFSKIAPDHPGGIKLLMESLQGKERSHNMVEILQRAEKGGLHRLGACALKEAYR